MKDNAPNHAGKAASSSSESREVTRPRDQAQLEFELDFYGRILAKAPNYVDVLRVHGNNLTAKGHYAKGLAVDSRLIKLRPKDPIAHYNLACSCSLLRMKDAAIRALEMSLDLGYRDFEHMIRDPDLAGIREDARFLGMLSRYLKKLKTGRKA